MAKVAKNKKCTGYFAYINDIENVLNIKCDAKSVDEFLAWENLEKTMAIRSLYLVRHTAKLHSETKLSSKTKTNELFALEV